MTEQVKSWYYRCALGLVAVAALLASEADAKAKHNVWSQGAAMPVPVWDSMAVTDGANIYVFGGADINLNTSAATQIYNPATDRWSAGADMPAPAGAGLAAVVGKTIYVVAGNEGTGNTLWAYNPATNSWSTEPDMPTGRGSVGGAAVGGMVYVAGGAGPSGGRLPTLESLTRIDMATR